MYTTFEPCCWDQYSHMHFRNCCHSTVLQRNLKLYYVRNMQYINSELTERPGCTRARLRRTQAVDTCSVVGRVHVSACLGKNSRWFLCIKDKMFVCGSVCGRRFKGVIVAKRRGEMKHGEGVLL